MASTATKSFFVPRLARACSLAIYAFRVLLAIFVFHHDGVTYALACSKERLVTTLKGCKAQLGETRQYT